MKHEFLKVNLNINRNRKFHNINGILYALFLNCYTSKNYPGGSSLKGEQLQVKKCFARDQFEDFTAPSR